MVEPLNGGLTLKQVEEKFKAGWANAKRWKNMNIRAKNPEQDPQIGGANGQMILENLVVKVGGKEYNAHITLTPALDDKDPGRCDSAHVTIEGAKYDGKNGNYFFAVIDGYWEPSDAPKKFKGQYSKNGSELGANCVEDVQKFMDGLFGFQR